MKKALCMAVVLLIVGFVVWCYLPSGNMQTIAFKMKVPFPSLYSRCLSQLGELGTPGAVSILTTEFNSDSRKNRNLAAQALSKTRWQPSNQTEQIRFLVARGQYREAAELGVAAIPALIEEFEQANEARARSQLCALLLKTGDQRASSAVQNYLREKLTKIGAIVQQALPPETRASTTMEEVSSTARRVVVAGHLLEGERPDDNSPYVRGDYANKQSLENKAKYRAFQIYQSIFRDVPMTEFESIVVLCKHGVRVQVVGFGAPVVPGFGGRDQAMTIFQTSLTPTRAENVNWENATIEAVEKAWVVENNMIPSLQFIAVPGGIR